LLIKSGTKCKEAFLLCKLSSYTGRKSLLSIALRAGLQFLEPHAPEHFCKSGMLLHRIPFIVSNRTFVNQNQTIAPTQEDIQNIMLEATLNAAKLLNRLIEKQSISSEEKNAAEIVLKFLDLTAQAGRG
jgi:hypothetical protein